MLANFVFCSVSFWAVRSGKIALWFNGASPPHKDVMTHTFDIVHSKNTDIADTSSTAPTLPIFAQIQVHPETNVGYVQVMF
jgi:hypothetical protein